MLQLHLNAVHKGLFEADVLQFVIEDAVCLLEGFPELLISIIEIPVHSDTLKSLTRENEPNSWPLPRIHSTLTHSGTVLTVFLINITIYFLQFTTICQLHYSVIVLA